MNRKEVALDDDSVLGQRDVLMVAFMLAAAAYEQFVQVE